MHRTHTCNDLEKQNVGEKVKLAGWVSNRRDHGGIIFIDLRDRYGISQIVFSPDNEELFKQAETLRSEFVVSVEGLVRQRPSGQENSNLKTGHIEIDVENLVIFSKSKTPPFEIDEHGALANEEIRYKYRYIDLRRKKALESMKFRSKFMLETRNYFAKEDFLEIQTPIFTVSSPEGARDFLIPSRIHPGLFYALPQAPQQYKQLLMVGGVDKYFQIAPCFRDEDSRADRHSCEFYQIDVEMSFVEQEDIFGVVEKYLQYIVPIVSNKKVLEFKKMTYEESLNTYGTDKPDIRFGMEFVDLTDIFVNSGFVVFKNIASSNGVIKAIKLENQKVTRKEIDELTALAQKNGAKGLAYIVYDNAEPEGKKSPILKFLSQAEIVEMEKRLNPKSGDIIFFSADSFHKAINILNVVRLDLRNRFNLADENVIAPIWITDFPIFEKDEETGKIDFSHNPFSMPQGGIKAFDREDLLNIKAIQYDLSINGFEVLSGGLRNYDTEALVKAFGIVGRNADEVKTKFGAMYEAFQYGVPPHGGFAIGMDRLIMILLGEPNIREIYAFPKAGKAQDLMMNAPSLVDDEQLEELHIKVVLPEEE